MENIAFRAIIVTKMTDRLFIRASTNKPITDPPADEVLSKIDYSLLNTTPPRKIQSRSRVAIYD